MVQPIIPRGGFPRGPSYKPPVGKNPALGGSPGLLTSTGGLQGTVYQVLMPLFDYVFEQPYCALFNGDDFNCEEEAFYFFPQEDIVPGREVSVHKIVIWYREIGVCQFKVGVRYFVESTGKFAHKDQVVKFGPRMGEVPSTFPDYDLHITRVSLVISGQKPQLFFARKANSGPLSIIRMMMVGKADTKEIM